MAFGAVSTFATGLVLREWLSATAELSPYRRTPGEGLTLSVASGFGSVADRSSATRSFTGGPLADFNGSLYLIGVPQSSSGTGRAPSSLEGFSASYTRSVGAFSIGLSAEWLNFGAGIDRILPVQDGSLRLRTAMRLDWVASATLRVGFDVSDRIALWTQAGPAIGHVRVGSGLEFVSGLWSERASEKLGWTAGIGADLRLSDGWLVSLGYSYFDLGSRRTVAEAQNGRLQLSSRTEARAHALRLSVGHRW